MINIENITNKSNIEKIKKWIIMGLHNGARTGFAYNNVEPFILAVFFQEAFNQILLSKGKYDNNQIISSNWIKEMCSMKLEKLSVYKPERVLPKIGIGYIKKFNIKEKKYG